MTTKAGVRVRGTCKAGHITETTADRGRATWNGTCSHDGCELPVLARRIPRERVPEPAAEHPHGDDTTRVVRVENYDHTSSGAQGDDGGIIVTDANPEPEAEPESVQGPGDPLDEHDQRRGVFARARDRSRARRPAGRFEHPLGIPLG